MEIECGTLTVEAFLALYREVGWEPPCAAQVETALRRSTAVFSAVEDGTPVGMLRLIGDGGMSFYLKDFAVLPTHQGRGVGARLLDAAERWIRAHIAPGWAVSLELISTPAAVPFYERRGFEARPGETDGPGMFKMLR